ncbi:MAG: bifunctional pyr operon transcriptional regulator/uracil phosphoribosyltransferase PyrR [Proteobacteria bacterium]|nr:bifunctional pyr operon transcriptional regulator/uracil phosphoribosyltransferase PyrR [Pseudomonadota bacterium]
MLKKSVLDKDGVARALAGMADEILARDPRAAGLVLVGIRTGGVFLAQRLKALLEKRTGRNIPTGVIDINLYRDDWTRVAHKPIVGKTELNFSMDDRRVLLVDDVLFTGRTVRAAMDALMDFGRPARIELAVLVDRGHRELPICSDFKGLFVETIREQRVNVYFAEQGDPDEVAVEWAD